MATLTIRNLPEQVRIKLRMRAAKRGVSMEAEARAILARAVSERLLPAGDGGVAALQTWVAACRKVNRGEKTGVRGLLRDRRRDAILEAAAEGLEPAEAFGSNFDRILSEAEWTGARSRKAPRKPA